MNLNRKPWIVLMLRYSFPLHPRWWHSLWMFKNGEKKKSSCSTLFAAGIDEKKSRPMSFVGNLKMLKWWHSGRVKWMKVGEGERWRSLYSVSWAGVTRFSPCPKCNLAWLGKCCDRAAESCTVCAHPYPAISSFTISEMFVRKSPSPVSFPSWC